MEGGLLKAAVATLQYQQHFQGSPASGRTERPPKTLGTFALVAPAISLKLSDIDVPSLRPLPGGRSWQPTLGVRAD